MSDGRVRLKAKVPSQGHIHYKPAAFTPPSDSRPLIHFRRMYRLGLWQEAVDSGVEPATLLL